MRVTPYDVDDDDTTAPTTTTTTTSKPPLERQATASGAGELGVLSAAIHADDGLSVTPLRFVWGFEVEPNEKKFPSAFNYRPVKPFVVIHIGLIVTWCYTSSIWVSYVCWLIVTRLL